MSLSLRISVSLSILLFVSLFLSLSLSLFVLLLIQSSSTYLRMHIHIHTPIAFSNFLSTASLCCLELPPLTRFSLQDLLFLSLFLIPTQSLPFSGSLCSSLLSPPISGLTPCSLSIYTKIPSAPTQDFCVSNTPFSFTDSFSMKY